MNRHCLDTFLKRSGTNVPGVFEKLGLVRKARTKLRIVDKSMLMCDEHGVFIRGGVTQNQILIQIYNFFLISYVH